MHTIRCNDTGMASGAFEAAEFFMANKRQTKVAISNAYTDGGWPAIVWHYKGSRKDLAVVHDNMVMVAEWPQEE